jgi:hypothetical protein
VARVAAVEAEPRVEPRGPAAGVGVPEAPDPQLVDADHEGIAAAGAADADRADQCVARVEQVAVAGLEAASRVDRPRLESPARVEGAERDRVAGVDLEHRLEVAREVTVERAALEGDLVDHTSERTLHGTISE